MTLLKPRAPLHEFLLTAELMAGYMGVRVNTMPKRDWKHDPERLAAAEAKRARRAAKVRATASIAEQP